MQKQRIGIWGFGAVGKSAFRFFHGQGNPLEILDLTESTKKLPDNVTYTQQQTSSDITDFLTRNDAILVSPGIDTSHYSIFRNKFINELDLMCQQLKKPWIGITGTVGKTTITTLLSQYLQQAGFSVGMGGNIGIPLLDVVAQQDCYNIAVFELSSFQLEYATQCSPHLAIWTNLYPNHLDRHLTVEQYFLSKFNIMRHQDMHDKALVPLNLMPLLQQYSYNFAHIRAQLYFFSQNAPTDTEKKIAPKNAHFMYLAHNNIMLDNGITMTSLMSLGDIPLKTYPENILVLAAALYCLEQPLTLLTDHQETVLEHRLEYVATQNTIAFYNDSKSTIMQATHAAVNALQPQNIILLLGGLSKGVDRTADIYAIASSVRFIICFGKEASTLHAVCDAAHIPAQQASTLEEAFVIGVAQARRYSNACVLLSPGGSSFDLFANYSERGNTFKNLVHGQP